MGAVSRRTGRRGRWKVVEQRKPWYGLRPSWVKAFEADARRVHGDELRVSEYRDRRVYRVPVEVPGRLQRVEITINFYERPPYDCYGLSPEEYPRVFSCTRGLSPHRMPSDGALCLYYPRSAPARRWQPENGLLALIDLARDHVFFEDYWRQTGGEDRGVWLGDEQAHGFPEQVSA